MVAYFRFRNRQQYVVFMHLPFFRDYCRYGFGQWVKAIHSNASSQWLSPYSDWSLRFTFDALIFDLLVIGFLITVYACSLFVDCKNTGSSSIADLLGHTGVAIGWHHTNIGFCVETFLGGWCPVKITQNIDSLSIGTCDVDCVTKAAMNFTTVTSYHWKISNIYKCYNWNRGNCRSDRAVSIGSTMTLRQGILNKQSMASGPVSRKYLFIFLSAVCLGRQFRYLFHNMNKSVRKTSCEDYR